MGGNTDPEAAVATHRDKMKRLKQLLETLPTDLVYLREAILTYANDPSVRKGILEEADLKPLARAMHARRNGLTDEQAIEMFAIQQKQLEAWLSCTSPETESSLTAVRGASAALLATGLYGVGGLDVSDIKEPQARWRVLIDAPPTWSVEPGRDCVFLKKRCLQSWASGLEAHIYRKIVQSCILTAEMPERRFTRFTVDKDFSLGTRTGIRMLVHEKPIQRLTGVQYLLVVPGGMVRFGVLARSKRISLDLGECDLMAATLRLEPA